MDNIQADCQFQSKVYSHWWVSIETPALLSSPLSDLFILFIFYSERCGELFLCLNCYMTSSMHASNNQVSGVYYVESVLEFWWRENEIFMKNIRHRLNQLNCFILIAVLVHLFFWNINSQQICDDNAQKGTSKIRREALKWRAVTITNMIRIDFIGKNQGRLLCFYIYNILSRQNKATTAAISPFLLYCTQQ